MAATRLPTFSFPQYLYRQQGLDSKTGFNIDIVCFGYRLLSFQLFDFTFRHSASQTINRQRHIFNLCDKYAFAYFENGLKGTDRRRWRDYFTQTYSEDAYAHYPFNTVDIDPRDRQYLKQRELEFKIHQKYLKCLSITTQQSAFITHSLDSLLFLIYPALSEIESILRRELHSCWWRRWLAKRTHVDCYQAYLTQYYQRIKLAKHQLASALCRRLQTAIENHDFTNDDVIYHALKACHQLNLSHFPIRQGFSINALFMLEDIIQRWGDDECLTQYEQLRQQQPDFFNDLNAFYCTDQLCLLPKTLQPFLPEQRHWPNFLFFVWNKCYDFFYQTPQHRLKIINNRLLLPHLLKQAQHASNPFNTPFCNLGWEQYHLIQQDLHDFPNYWYQGIWAFLMLPYHYLLKRWQSFLKNEFADTVVAIIEYAKMIDKRICHENIIHAETAASAQQTLISLENFHNTASINHAQWQMMKTICQTIRNKLDYLRQTPTHQHEIVEKHCQQLVRHQVVPETHFQWLIQFYRHPPFDHLDFPNDVYTHNYQQHIDHYHAFIPAINQLLQRCTNCPLPTNTTRIKQCYEYLLQVNPLPSQKYFLQQSLKKMTLLFIKSMRREETESLTAQCQELLAIAELNDVFSETVQQLSKLLELLQYPLSPQHQEDALWVAEYTVYHSLYQDELLQDIDSLISTIQQKNSEQNVPLSTFFAAQRDFVCHDALSIEKLEQARQACRQKLRQQQHIQNETLFTKEYLSPLG